MRTPFVLVVLFLLAVAFAATSVAAPNEGVDITIVWGDMPAVTITDPGCVNLTGSPEDLMVGVRSGYWVSNGQAATGEWIIYVSNGAGEYRLDSWPAWHVCGGETPQQALEELWTIDPGSLKNRQVLINPGIQATPTPTATPTLAATPTPTRTPTPVATATPLPDSGVLVAVEESGKVTWITDPGCINFPAPAHPQITLFQGYWYGNGVYHTLCAASTDCGGDVWENVRGPWSGVYDPEPWRFLHICGGRTYEEARDALFSVDPNAANNPQVGDGPIRELDRLFTPLQFGGAWVQ